MGIVARMDLSRIVNTSTLDKLLMEHFGGMSTSSGVSVNTSSAMRIMTVQTCVNDMSRSLAQLPLHLMKREGKNTERAVEHSLYRILHDQPNSWMTSFEFWQMAMVHVLLRGNFYSIKSRLPGRPIKELIPLPIGAVQEVVQNRDYSLTYKILVPDQYTAVSDTGDMVGNPQGARIVSFPESQIMHLRGLVVNGFMGLNPIQYAREGLGLTLAMEKFGARYFGAGIHPGMIIEHPTSLKDPKAFREAVTEVYAGLGVTHNAMLLQDGMKATFPSIKPEDSQFLESRNFQKKEIIDLFFGMPLALFQSGDKTSTYASASQFSSDFVKYGIMPYAVNFEKAIYRDLLNEEEKKTYYAKFSAGALLRSEMKERAEFYRELINCEVMNPNEARELEEWNPYEGGDRFATRTSTVKRTPEDNQGESK